MVKLVQEYFSNSAKKFPDKIAVNFENESATFAELERGSNQLARALKSRGIRKGDRVCFCLAKSIQAIKVILAILKADAVYVPLNIKAPAVRLKQVVDDALPHTIICDEKTRSLVGGLPGIFDLTEQDSYIKSFEDSSLNYENESLDLAYILYTSGSTGKPKGVMIRHSNIINATEWAVDEFKITADDRMSQHPPLHFDLSTFDLYSAFKSGATLFLVSEELSIFPGQLIKFMEEKRLTVWNSVPSVMVYLSSADLVKPNRIPTVRKIFFNGEGFPTKFLAQWMQTYPDKILVNMYGPTETTVQCTFYTVKEIPKDLVKLVPIGKACRNVEVFAVKEDGGLVAPGEVGELYVGGLGVGAGYWNNPKKTAASFIAHPFEPSKGIVYKTGDLVKLSDDGNFEFLGRRDHQIKVMGNRVELGDVEAAIYSLPYVQDAGAVAVDSGEAGGLEIVAFLKISGEATPVKIKEDLEKLLPNYMIPKKIEIRGFLPRTNTGKIDRIKLKEEYGLAN